MPRLCEFYGIVIYMCSSDHQPPHFHAIYGDDEALVRIDDGSFLRGRCRARRRCSCANGPSRIETT